VHTLLQVSNYNTDVERDAQCNTIGSLSEDPCCAARGAFVHATWSCTAEKFTSGAKKGSSVKDCPHYTDAQVEVQ
jgi:hypothetical protein